MMPSSLQRLSGLIWQELYVTRHRLEIAVDTLAFPLINVVLFGYIMAYIGSGGELDGQVFIVGVLLWQILVVMQYNTTVSTMWSIWSHNLTNVFIAPISVTEYLVAQAGAALVRSLAVGILLAVGAGVVFDFNILSLGLANLAIFMVNVLLFAYALGVAFLGIIFRYGVRVQAIAWGAVYLFQPLTAAFFPVSVLPGFLQAIAYGLPPTYVFEAGRAALLNSAINWQYALIALALNLLYLALGICLFLYLFKKSRQSGQFARNDL